MIQHLSTAAVVLLAVSIGAQQQNVVFPPAARTVDLPSSTNSPLRRSGYERALYVHSRNMFIASSPTPLEIRGIRLRADAGASPWTGTTISNLRVDMSHAAVAFDDPATVFDENHGGDRVTVFQGPWTVPAGTATSAPFAASIPLQPPFVFDPRRGDDLVIDYTTQGATSAAGVPLLDGSTLRTVPATRVNSFVAGSATGDAGRAIHAFEVEFVPASGLFPAYSVDVRRGATPLTVQFTDRSYTSDPGGILSWAWDFDGDGAVDSTLRSPSFVFANCGTFSPTLTVTDAAHGSRTYARAGWIRTDDVQAEFDAVTRFGAGPLTVQFNDRSAGQPTAWAWDFDSNGTVDSTAQNPSFTFAPGFYDVTLRVSRNCRGDAVTKVGFVVANRGLQTVMDGTDGLDPPGVQFGNLTVLRPGGVRLTAFDAHCQEPVGTPFGFDVYIASEPFAAITGNVAQWRKIASGSATSNGYGTATLVDTNDVFLPAGQYGIAIQMVGAIARYSFGPGGTVTYRNSDLAFESGVGRFGYFTGFQRNSRIYNGAIYYDVAPTGSVNAFGVGCAGSAGVPSLAMQPGTALRTGRTFGLEFGGLPPSEPLVILFYGYDHTRWNGLPLPLDLASYGMPGCFGRAEAFEALLLLNAGGQASWNVSLPGAAGLVGAPVFFQGLVLDRAANVFGAVVSDSVAGTIGG